MKRKHLPILPFLGLLILTLFSCNREKEESGNCGNPGFFSNVTARSFRLGFGTWVYAPRVASVDSTYEFIAENSDIYSEHLDLSVPWKAWISGSALPEEFIADINSRKSRKIPGKKLTVSVSFLNTSRDDIANDYDGSVPEYTDLNDKVIEDAYLSHLRYIKEQLEPDYLIISIESNELLIHSPQKWPAYKKLMSSLRQRLRKEYPGLPLSESITLHNLYKPNIADPEDYISEISGYTDSLDFTAVSFYPFFKGLKTRTEFTEALDFLNSRVKQPVAFSETGQLSENLKVEAFSLFIPADQCGQKEYLEVLLENAQEHNYSYIIWWTHRDYDELLSTFPAEVQDLGKLWVSTGIIDGNGEMKKAYQSWKKALDIPFNSN